MAVYLLPKSTNSRKNRFNRFKHCNCANQAQHLQQKNELSCYARNQLLLVSIYKITAINNFCLHVKCQMFPGLPFMTAHARVVVFGRPSMVYSGLSKQLDTLVTCFQLPFHEHFNVMYWIKLKWHVPYFLRCTTLSVYDILPKFWHSKGTNS